MLVHALGQLIVHRVARAICNRRQFLLSDQIVENTIFVIERVVVHASLCRNKVGNSLGMLASNDRVVQHEVVESLVRILEVELDQFNTVCEGVDGQLGTLCNRNELFFITLDSMTRVHSQRTQVPGQRLLIFQVDRSQSSHLHVEELSSVEHSLLLLSCHLIEQVGVILSLIHI